MSEIAERTLKMIEMSKTMTNEEIGYEFDITPDAVRHTLSRYGCKAARFCYGCGINKPYVDFEYPQSKMCELHENGDEKKILTTYTLQDQVFMQEISRLQKKVNKYWNATEGALRYWWHEEAHSLEG